MSVGDWALRPVPFGWRWNPLTSTFYLCSPLQVECSLSVQALCSFSQEPVANKCSDTALYICATVICGTHITFSFSLTRIIKANEDAMLIEP